MKLDIITAANTHAGKKDMPVQFSEEIRPDLIKRAVEAIQSNRRQPYGSDPMAGKRASAKLSKRRRDYKTVYGHGISRTPRKIMTRRGTQMNWTGAFAPNTVGGRRAHPPKAWKVWNKKINKAERRKAIRSAMAASIIKKYAEERGHFVPEKYPFLIENKAESFSKTREVIDFLVKIGLSNELGRISKSKLRAGKGKYRGRRHITRKGPLLIVGNSCPLLRSASNIQGVDAVEVNNLNAELLAPGGNIGRLALFTENAIDRLTKENLFAKGYKANAKDIKGKSEEKKKDIKNDMKAIHNMKDNIKGGKK